MVPPIAILHKETVIRKLFIVAIFFSSLFLSCGINTTYRNIENTNVTDTQPNIKKKAEQLKKAYQKLSSSPHTKRYQQEYFEAFPNTFVLLNKLFGYSDKEPFGEPFFNFNSPLYEEAELYVSAFFVLDSIEKTLYNNRIMDISINGSWYADGVNYFQHGMKEKVNDTINLFCKLLSKRSDNEIKSFWYFYFNSPHPAKKLPTELEEMKEIDAKNFSLMKLALKEVQQAWKK